MAEGPKPNGKWVEPLQLEFNEPTAPRRGSVADIFRKRAIKVGRPIDVKKAIGRP